MSLTKFDINGLLTPLKAIQLQRIARLTGASTGGTKSELRARLDASLTARNRDWNEKQTSIRSLSGHDQHASQDNGYKAADEASKHGQQPYRILSIDMGIRNLAFCTIDIDRQWLVPSKLDDSVYGLTLPQHRPAVTVQQWQRLALSTKARAFSEPLDLLRTSATATTACSQDPVSNLESETPLKELFTPSHLAPVAWQVLSTLVFGRPEASSTVTPGSDLTRLSQHEPVDNKKSSSFIIPSTILIEKQRWRSGGGAAVQEWTLRVNSLEAMLWSGLQVLRALGVWRGVVHAVDPGAVARFWLPDGVESGRKGKEAKMGVVKGWIAEGSRSIGSIAREGESLADESSHGISWAGQAERTKEAFMADVKRGQKASTKKSKGRTLKDKSAEDNDANTNGDEVEETMTKKDDLADCLLQGMAWLRWEENKRAFLRGELTEDV